MLSIFPDLLLFSIVAPTVLRIAAGIFFIALAVHHVRARGAMKATRFPIFGSVGGAAIWILILLEVVVGILLIIGLYTQVAALVGLILALIFSFFGARIPALAPHSQTAYLLLAVICFSLLLLGAGYYAFDLPL